MNTLLQTVFSIFILLGAKSVHAQQEKDAFIDTLSTRILKEAILFPQEKIYVQINKPYYITGETIWFRAHLADALSLQPDSVSRYVYGELINPHDSIVSRVKIRPTDGAYSGYIDLPEDLPEGEYQLRYYTRFMENIDEHYFFKRKITVGDPLSALYRTEASFQYENESKKKMIADLRFVDAEEQKTIMPESVYIRNQAGNIGKIKTDGDSVFHVTLPAASDGNANSIYVEYTYLGRIHRQFMPTTITEEDYHVDFFPEGGNIVTDNYNKIAFKAINHNGLGEDVTGCVVNDSGDTITTFRSDHLGMGTFILNPLSQSKYRVVCTNRNNQTKTFDLPEASPQAISLQTAFRKEYLYIDLRKPADFVLSDSLYLTVLCRGMLTSVIKWNSQNNLITIDKNKLPTGVIHIMLIDQHSNPISERLVFNRNKGDIVKHTFSSDKEAYRKREEVEILVDLSDSQNLPLFADLSVSVTDDKDIKPDSCVNILSSLLLTSDLTGHIENPAYYFENDDVETNRNLDMLMMTQGWRRYNVIEAAKGEIKMPTIPVETSQQISGTVKGGLLMNRGGAKLPITIISARYNLFAEGVTGDKGRFTFKGFELPDSTKYMLQGQTKKGGSRVELIVDEERFPPAGKQLPALHHSFDRDVFDDYMEKADQQYTLENGMRIINLKGVEVTARKRSASKGSSIYSSGFNTSFTAEDIEESNAIDIFHLLMGVAGVNVSGEQITIRDNPGPPLILVDDLEVEVSELSFIPIQEVKEVEIAKGPEAAIFGFRGANGAIMVTTKRGEPSRPPAPSFNIKTVTPLGYQITKEFYTPKYETIEEIRNPKPDLRSNIYWNPSVKTDKTGKASISFYTADTPSTYSIILEGITTDGKIVHIEEKIDKVY